MSQPLSESTEARLVQLFTGDELLEARELLESDCADNVAGWRMVGLDRLRIATLKLSGGTLLGLVDAITLAQTDCRAALVAAGFADELDAHERWWPE
jgi:hypothetical protein